MNSLTPSPKPKPSQTADKKQRFASREVRRQQLIDATITSIAENGLAGTTMTTITKAAGLSIGLANFHFQSKEKLLEATLRFIAEEHRDQWKKSYDKAGLAPTDKLLAIVDAHYHPRICNRKKLAVWFGFYGEAKSRAHYRRIMQEIDPERWELSLELIEQISVEGNYQGVDAHEIAETLEGLYDGFCLNILIYPDEFTKAHARARIVNYLHRVFPNSFAAVNAN